MAVVLAAAAPPRPPCDTAAALALETSCRRLLWDLRLHLRLEERWLRAQGCLCQGHLANHQAGLRAALPGVQQSAGERKARQRWLGAVQTWFNGLRHGPDAMAYALATSRAKASQPISDHRPASIAPQP